MRRKLLTTLFLLPILILSCNNEALENDPEVQQNCDNGTFVGRVSLFTQQDVNEFGAMCYTKIDGTLVINDLSETEDKITDLSPLINLKEIFTETYPDSLYASFHFRTSLLTNFEGLNNLEKVGRLVVQDNVSLESFEGLESLTTIGTINEVPLYNELNIQNNVTLENLYGLNNLVEIGYGTNLTRLRIWGNPELSNIDGFESLTSIHSSEIISGFGGSGNLHIVGNNQLTNVDGFNNLSNLHGGRISFIYLGDLIGPDGCTPIVGNSSLTDFCGLQALINSGDYNGFSTGGFANCYENFAPSAQDIIDGNCSQ